MLKVIIKYLLQYRITTDSDLFLTY